MHFQFLCKKNYFKSGISQILHQNVNVGLISYLSQKLRKCCQKNRIVTTLLQRKRLQRKKPKGQIHFLSAINLKKRQISARPTWQPWFDQPHWNIVFTYDHFILAYSLQYKAPRSRKKHETTVIHLSVTMFQHYHQADRFSNRIWWLISVKGLPNISSAALSPNTVVFT